MKMPCSRFTTTILFTLLTCGPAFGSQWQAAVGAQPHSHVSARWPAPPTVPRRLRAISAGLIIAVLAQRIVF